ncbi:macrolide 2'-phosphotransferase [Bacillus sp. DX1.1]|uniref:macrolide 2'-phosphotransferase n=1 Tax=unclassified Bacillus (in: firmicutes) TaxID=185979 RepID=UPI0025701A38|nr:MULTISPECIES: macrolide 2'-phosphotransferase [unclassified Bacillus (in: firmicutes)]MDM5155142.1 macrolide 2'-phosphotransferase [Bacillus sp. DX1.1]WJE79470.1 macrolide 2'-phosphotransferase [Bacillus sp. DX3.1]
MTNSTEKKSIEEILEIARKNGLQLNEESAELNESGMDFQVVFVNDENEVPWVLRKPRRPDVIERGATEGSILQLVQKYLPVAVPDWKINTPELIAYPRVTGTPAAVIDLEIQNYVWHINNESLSINFIKSLAESLVALHAVDHHAATEYGIEVLQPVEAKQLLVDRMYQIKAQLGVSDELWVRWEKWLADETYWPKHSVFVHGDLHPPHILVDENDKVTGLLDWTEAKVTDPATDFTLYLTIFGEDNLKVLLNEYEKAGGKVWPRMFEHIIELGAAYPVMIGLFALQTKEEGHLEMARGALGVNEK